jgi:hypothetical protein
MPVCRDAAGLDLGLLNLWCARIWLRISIEHVESEIYIGCGVA